MLLQLSGCLRCTKWLQIHFVKLFCATTDYRCISVRAELKKCILKKLYFNKLLTQTYTRWYRDVCCKLRTTNIMIRVWHRYAGVVYSLHIEKHCEHGLVHTIESVIRRARIKRLCNICPKCVFYRNGGGNVWNTGERYTENRNSIHT